MVNHQKVMSVGALSTQAGCNIETVRYYENIGLMPEPPRSEGGHRQYTHSHAKRLCFIRRSRELGFPIDQVRELLKLIDEPNHTCGEVKAITVVQAREVQKKISDLERLRDALNKMTVSCSGGSYTVDDCPIIDALFEQ